METGIVDVENGYQVQEQLSAWSDGVVNRKKPFITLSREFGASGWTLAQELENRLNQTETKYPWIAYNRDMISQLAGDKQLSKELLKTLEKPVQNSITQFMESVFSNIPSRSEIFYKTAGIIKRLAAHGHAIIVGLGGSIIAKGMPEGFYVRTIAPFEQRVKRIAYLKNVTSHEAEKIVKKRELERDDFIKEYLETNVHDPHHFDLVINLARTNSEQAATMIIEAMKARDMF